MIIWGGFGGNGQPDYLDTGGKYNPSSDSWADTVNSGAPSARTDHTAVWTGSKMIIWGGINSSGYLDTGGIYLLHDIIPDEWTPTSTINAPTARRYHTAIFMQSLILAAAKMIVWGGEIPSDNYTNTGGKYDPNIDTWYSTSTTNAPSARYLHTAVWSGTEMIIWGGWDLDYTSSGGRYCP